MPRLTTELLTIGAALFVFSAVARPAAAHCQVPCGIYGDQRQFEQMLEDQATIEKAMKQVTELAEKEGAQSHNQLARWVVTKEEHATNTQRIIADYFMAQRIKPGEDREANAAYVKKLIAAHRVMQAAMKAKQTIDPAAAEALEKAIFDLYRAYEGKEPDFHEHD